MCLSRSDWGRVVASALLLNLAYPPFHLLVPSFVCLAPLIAFLEDSGDTEVRVRRAAAGGFWFGLVANGLLFNWVAVALWRFNPLLSLAYGPAIVLLATYTALTFAICAWATNVGRIPLLVVFPLAWTSLEFLLTVHPVVQLSWLGLGTSLTGFSPLVQIADLVGARGVTFLLVLANVGVAGALRSDVQWRRRMLPIAFVATGILLSSVYGALRTESIRVQLAGRAALIQPNVGAHQKWDTSVQDSIFNATLDLSLRAVDRTNPELVVWPEVAVPGPLEYRQDWKRDLSSHARSNRVWLLVGALHADTASERVRSYNAAFLFDETGGVVSATYQKTSLVPLFERFNGIAEGDSRPLLETPVGRLGVMICYETAFPRFARSHQRAGADVLVAMSNDAWFNATTGPSQHRSHLVMRAIETRRGIARAANTGVSGFVDPLGRLHHATREDETTFVDGPLLTSSTNTVYAGIGSWLDWLYVVGLGVAVISGMAGGRRPTQAEYLSM
jgi:apolipoprotein N-acyltransferase